MGDCLCSTNLETHLLSLLRIKILKKVLPLCFILINGGTVPVWGEYLILSNPLKKKKKWKESLKELAIYLLLLVFYYYSLFILYD